MKKMMLGLAMWGVTMASMTGAQTGSPAATQSPAPGAPGPAPNRTISAPNSAVADTQSPAAPAAIKFPPTDPKNFTAANPTPQTVDSFLHSVWGVDENRQWQVASIQPASSPGFVKVEVYVADKRQPARVGTYSFLVTPDGKHAVAGDLTPFGANPFGETRATLQQRADGPARGASSKDLELVEFADLQCPNCKAAQSTMDQLAKDFPQAHIVFQNLPLPGVHPFAMQAAEVGNCVRQAKGDPVFFLYAQKVYDTQADLTTDKADATLRAAVTAAGADPASVMACASQPATKAAVDASAKLATDLGVTGTPTIAVNGRLLPLSQIPYAGLKKIVVYQGQLDGIAVKEQPSLSTLK